MATKLATAFALVEVARAAIDFAPCPQLNEQIAAELPAAADLATFDCANVSVPLDYTSDDSEDLTLNLFRVNANEEPILGNVLINFGGPGGTGAENLPAYASALREVIGPQWNLLSWDPRGTGKTIPFQCAPPTGLTDDTTNTKRDIEPLVRANATEGFLEYGWDFAGQIADSCAQQSNDTGTLIGTAFTARDVIQIVDALDDGNLLHYYGWSYGTALGSYIAAVFPDRIGRMVQDGNVNPNEYRSGTYLHAANDIDQTWDGFLRTCFEAQEDCSLYSFVQPNSTDDLAAAINAGVGPLAQFATATPSAYIAFLAVKNVPVAPLYFPAQWPSLADTITLLLNSTGDTSAIANASTTAMNSTYDEAENAVLGIRGSDATFHANSSEEYLPTVQAQANMSQSFGDSYCFSIWASARWQMPAKERYWGDFRAETNTPILYVNGEYDPVTPIIGAYNASAGFAGSVVLAHTGYGHGLLASPSSCASRYIQQYFKNGTLPANGTTCEPDSSTLEVWQAVVAATGNGTNAGNGTFGGSSGDGQTSGNDDGDGDADQSQSSGSGDQQSQDSGASAVSSEVSVMGASAAMLLGLVVANL